MRVSRRLLPFGLLPWSRAAAEALTLDTLMAAMAGAPARQAGFVEERRFAALDAPLESRGTLAYRPGHLEKVTQWPVPERLEIDGDRVIVTAGNEAPRVIPLSMAPELGLLIDAIRAPLSGDVGALRRAFHCVVTGTVAGWVLTLVPRDGAGVLRSVRIEGRGDAIGRIAVVQGNGDSQVMTIVPG
jgi:hypothetical protein